MPRRAACGSDGRARSASCCRTCATPSTARWHRPSSGRRATRGYGVMVVAGERDLVRERLALRIFSEHGTDGGGDRVERHVAQGAPRAGRSRIASCWSGRTIASMPRRVGPPIPGVIQTDDASGVRGRGPPPHRQRANAASAMSRAGCEPPTRSVPRPSPPRSVRAASGRARARPSTARSTRGDHWTSSRR